MEKRATTTPTQLIMEMVEQKHFTEQDILTKLKADGLQGEDIAIPAGYKRIAPKAFICCEELHMGWRQNVLSHVIQYRYS